MPTSRAGRKSNKNPGRSMRIEGCHDGQLDILAPVDTRFPDLRSKGRGLPGNGKTPGNPFGHQVKGGR